MPAGMKPDTNKQAFRYVVLPLLLFAVLGALVFGPSLVKKNKEPGPCDGQQWERPGDRLDCMYPDPPIGRWHAVYTKEFAQEHGLPPEKISTDLSPGVDYMEMEVLPYGPARVCLVSMLIKKPHDVALYDAGRKLVRLPEDRKLMRLVDIDEYKDKLKPVISISSASRDYKIEKRGYQASTFAVYAEDVLPNYDYIAADAKCRSISMHPQSFPDGYAFWINKASVWGRYENRYRRYNTPGRPTSDRDFYNSHFFINVPHELVSSIFENVPIGGR
ncbi:MAG: hypothetical protein KDI11_05020 [Alphaproteobacteria bacterium]|nr:hypothetical protein [Alphaproteobacteria bacterium]